MNVFFFNKTNQKYVPTDKCFLADTFSLGVVCRFRVRILKKASPIPTFVHPDPQRYLREPSSQRKEKRIRLCHTIVRIFILSLYQLLSNCDINQLTQRKTETSENKRTRSSNQFHSQIGNCHRSNHNKEQKCNIENGSNEKQTDLKK
jgi:hypothetical protein